MVIDAAAFHKTPSIKEELSRSIKAGAPFKIPKKVMKGSTSIETFLDKRPIMRDITNDVGGVRKENVPVVYDLTGFDDDMAIDF